jgi:hypothetical protein
LEDYADCQGDFVNACYIDVSTKSTLNTNGPSIYLLCSTCRDIPNKTSLLQLKVKSIIAINRIIATPAARGV